MCMHLFSFPIVSSRICMSWVLLLPTATNIFKLFCYLNISHKVGSKSNLIILIKSVLFKSYIFSDLSYVPVVQASDMSSLTLNPPILPLWALKCLTKSTSLKFFFQNLMWPSMLQVITISLSVAIPSLQI